METLMFTLYIQIAAVHVYNIGERKCPLRIKRRWLEEWEAGSTAWQADGATGERESVGKRECGRGKVWEGEWERVTV